MQKSFIEQADHLVRHHAANKELMELEFGCRVKKSDMWEGVVVGEAYEQVAYLNYDKMQVFLAPAEQFEILGKPPQLQHYLRVLWSKEPDIEVEMAGMDRCRVFINYDASVVLFISLTTGAPVTEKDAEEFLRLVGQDG